jgi:PiT family inorganic phosphate transporter
VVAIVALVVAGVASLFMAWSIGAGSSGSTPFAPAVGANAISVMRAGFLVGLLGFAGATLQGANVSEAIGRELIRGVTLSPLAAIVGLFTAAALVAVGVFAGYPIATAFTVTGAVVGVGLALGGDPAWAKYREIVALWVLVPFVGGGISYATSRVLRERPGIRTYVIAVLAALVGLIVANVEFTLLGSSGVSESLAATVADAAGGGTLPRVLVSAVVAVGVGGVMYSALRTNETRAERRFLLVLGGLVAFSAGGSQVGLAIGPLLPLLEPLSPPLVAVLLVGGLGLLAGSWTGAPRMIKALSQDYSALDSSRSIAALVPSFAIAQTAVFFGIPVSFNEIIISAIVGSGYAASGAGGISRKKMLYTVGAWIGSLAIAIGFGYAAFTAVETVW